MSVVNKITTDAVFYLHFELKDINHAKESIHQPEGRVCKRLYRI
jgi:hypothetical protein